MKIEIHILQNFAPSCLNRDDTNTPKTCTFGGTARARISSQSWKRAIRDNFRRENSQLVGTRTKRLVSILQERMPDTDVKVITKFVTDTYSKMDGKKPEETAVLLFIGEPEISAVEDCIREGVSGKVAEERLKAARHSVDVALFGRMLAEKPDGNVDAACQVAHAMSTHSIELEEDFFTAVDDIVQQRNEIGAGMMGIQGFNSACFYRYALLDVDQLKSNLGGDEEATSSAVREFLKAFSLSIPGAKQNSHAAQSLPSYALYIARNSGAPISLANAFARPIRGGDDLIGKSIEALEDYKTRVNSVYGLYDGATEAGFNVQSGESGSFAQAIDTIVAQVA